MTMCRARRPALVMVLVLALLTGWAASAAAKVFSPETFTLANGLQVVVIPNHRVPVVSHMVWYKVGSADEQAGKTGLAHFLEHLMFKGTDTVPAGEFSKTVARLGGRDNAFTAADYTAYYQNIAVDRLPRVMAMEADRMAHLKLAEKDFQTERQVVLEERRMRIDNNPAGLLGERADAALFVKHPYRNPVIGWYDEIEGLSRQDAVDFYKKWYAPNNAVLVVAGDITAAQLRPLAESTYGKLARREVPVRARPQEPPSVAMRRVELRDARVRQPSWSRTYLAPSYKRGETRYAYALQVLAEVVGGGSTSQLYRGLVVDRELADSAGASYEPGAVDLATFTVYASPRPGVPLDKLERAMLAEMTKIADAGVSAEEVERAKTRLGASVAYQRDSLYTGTQVLGSALAIGRTVDDVEAWPDRIAAVTPAEVSRAAAAVLDVKASVTGLLLPDPKAPPEARIRAFPPASGFSKELH